MMKRVWYIGLTAALGALIAACTGGDKLSGSSFETENSVALTVHQGGGPVARAKVLVRPSDFLASANNLSLSEQEGSESPVAEADSSLGVLNMETDEQGQLRVPRLKAGNYTIEVRYDSVKAVKPIVVKDSSFEEITLTVSKTGSMSGQVYLPEGYSSVTVGIQGLDYFVQTDSLGNFKFENLPAGDFTVVGYVFSTYEIPGADGSLSTYNSFLPVGSSAVTVASKEVSKNVTIGQPVVPADTAAKDTVTKDSVAKDTVEPYPVVLFEDFEDSTYGSYGWYTTVSKYADAKLETDDAGLGREGTSAHFVYTNDSNYNWVLMGKALRKPTDMSELDSVEFWARAGLGDSTQWISLSFDVQMDSVDLEKHGYENGKAWKHFALDTVWRRYVVTPEDVMDTTRIGGNIGWDKVKDHVTNLNIFGGGVGGPFEMWVDDIVIYGVKELE